MSEKKEGVGRSFLIRFRSSLILMVITGTSIILGDYVLFSVLLLVSLIGLMELYRLQKIHKTPAAVVGYIFAIILYLSSLDVIRDLPFVQACTESGGTLPIIVGAFLIVLLAVYVFAFPKYDYSVIRTVFFGFFYVALTMSYIYRLRIGQAGAYSVWLIFIGSWGADTMAYIAGILLGKHKIAPVLSPKKTLEGCIGGVLGATLIGFIYSMIFKDALLSTYENPVLLFTVVSACASLVSMIGDLAASAIKRNMEIKDYGNLIPGHGGILDRFDSVIFVAPVIYYLLTFMG